MQSNFPSRNSKFTFELAVSQAGVQAAGDWVFSRCRFTPRDTPNADGGVIEDICEYPNVLRREPDGSWKIARHIWNNDRLFPGPTQK
jgi:ketosteroid isomerase-like protein